jgi:glutaminyl-peptide cyclotransferase
VRRLLALCTFFSLSTIAVASPPAQLTARPFDAHRAYRDLLRQCDFGPRVPGSPAHGRCAAWLADRLRQCADRVDLQTFEARPRGEQLRLTNIIATFNPPEAGAPHILLCAHWDTRPTADRDPDPARRGQPIPGANDGASGVAVLLEIARALKAHPPRQRITIVFFDGEDYGPTADDMFFGSRHFAESFKGPPVEWGVLLDMVGDRDLRLPPERHSLLKAPHVVDRVWGAAARAGCPAFLRQPGPAVLDDHVFLLRRGIPVIDVIDFDYPHWHTLADTPDKCSPESLSQVGRALLRALAEDEAARR